MPPPRRLSPLDAAFLYFERPNQRLHVGCVALLEGPLPFDAFTRVVIERFAPVRRYHERPVRPLLDLDWPHWERDSSFDVHRHVRHVAVPAPGDEAALRELVDTLFSTPLDRHHPLWEAYLIDGLAGGRAALLWKVHHSMIDGVSGAQLVEVLADRPPDAREPAPRSGGGAQTAAAFLARLRAAAAATNPATLLATARHAAEALRMVATFVREPASTLPFNGHLSDARRIVWASFALDDFLALRGAAGCKVNDVVLAVIAGALRGYLAARRVRPDALRVRALIPVSMRGDSQRLTLGNLVSAMFVTLPVDVADPTERLRAVARETRTLKEREQAQACGLALQAVGALPAPVSAVVGRVVPETLFVNTVCTNVPGPPEARTLLGRRILEIHPIVPLFQGMGLEFAIMSYARRISICAAADPHLVSDAATIREHLLASAAELRAALAPHPGAAAAEGNGGGPRVDDLMTRDVVTIRPEASLARAYAIMRARRIRHLPVLDAGGRLVGILTHRDVLAATSSSLDVATEAARVWLLGRGRAADVMETHLSVAAADEPAATAGERMARHKIGCLPVIAPDGELVGIVTAEDFLRWATQRMAAGSSGPGAGEKTHHRSQSE
jgi:WS/DGAT/MGAT family acyltransferase